jgi:hypothetical protein
MNEQLSLVIAQAILANTQVLQTLVNALPQSTRTEVEKVVSAGPKQVSATVASPAPTPTAPVTATSASVPVQAPVVPSPVAASPSNIMPPPPVFTAPAAPAPVSGKAPFTDGKTMIAYVMSVYKQLGAEKGAGIQKVLDSLGTKNINDVKPEHYDALFAGVEALKA